MGDHFSIMVLWPRAHKYRAVGMLREEPDGWHAFYGSDRVVRQYKQDAIDDFLREFVL